jgi:acyl-CoA synthetase (AMP-forming)/AMP-acid ligase II
MTMYRIEEILRDYARRSGAKCVPGFAGVGFSFGELDDRSERLAGVLQANEIGREDRVAIFMDNSPQAIVAIMAALKAGATFCLIEPPTSAERLAFVINDCAAACLFIDAGMATVTAEAMPETPFLRLVVVAGAEGSPAIDGLLRFEDAVATERQPLVDHSTYLDEAMVFYPPQTGGRVSSRAVTHVEIIDAACPGARPIAGGLFPVLLAAVTAMRSGQRKPPGVAA